MQAIFKVALDCLVSARLGGRKVVAATR